MSMIFFSHFNCYLHNHILLIINYFHCHFNKQLTLHSILIHTLEERDQEYVKHFEWEDEADKGLEDGVNECNRPEDFEECATYIAATAATMKDREKDGNSKLPTLKVTKFKIINYSTTTTCFPIFN